MKRVKKRKYNEVVPEPISALESLQKTVVDLAKEVAKLKMEKQRKEIKIVCSYIS